jgi:hypothetical protein
MYFLLHHPLFYFTDILSVTALMNPKRKASPFRVRNPQKALQERLLPGRRPLCLHPPPRKLRHLTRNILQRLRRNQ